MSRRAQFWLSFRRLRLGELLGALVFGAAMLVWGKPLALEMFTVIASSSKWGTPCPLPHPPPCYSGAAESAGADVAEVGGRSALSVSSPSAVVLICFNVQGSDAVVDMEWQTATELETAGFYLLRSLQPGGGYQPISEFIVHCDDGGLVGGYYSFRDETVVNGQTYYYKLAEVISALETAEYGPLIAKPAVPTSTPTASLTPTPSNTPTPSSTPTPNEVPPPVSLQSTQSPVPSPTATATAAPSSTSANRTPAVDQASQPTSTGTAASAVPADLSMLQPALSPTGPPAFPLTVTPLRAASTAVAGGSAGRVDAETSRVPQAVAQATLVDSAYPAPPSGVAIESLATAYPPPLPTPDSSPFPAEYVPPASRPGSAMATMTGLPAASAGTADAAGPPHGAAAQRLWLYAGFGLSLLIVAAVLAALARLGGRCRRPAGSGGGAGGEWRSEETGSRPPTGGA